MTDIVVAEKIPLISRKGKRMKKIHINIVDCIPWGKYGAVILLGGGVKDTDQITLFESGQELYLKKSDPWKVGRFGRGRYALKNGKLYFSSSDCSSVFENNWSYDLTVSPPDKDICCSNTLYPRDVGIEITNVCNARCCYCPLYQNNENSLKYSKGYMDMRLFQKIIDEISDWPGWISIYLNNGGEPLLDRFFKERIEYCYKKGMSEKIIMQTNAEFLTEEYAQILLDAGIGYIFPAFDGATKETYEKHRVNCHFENVMDNIRRFAFMRDEGDYGTSIQVKFMRTKQNEAELLQTYHIFNEFLSPELDHFQEEYAHTWNEKYMKRKGIALTDINSSKIVRECRMVNSYLPIFRNGDIGACSLDYNHEVLGRALGNVKTESLLEIWNGEEFSRMRKAMRRLSKYPFRKGKIISKIFGLPQKCQDCYLMYYKEGNIDNLLPEEMLYCKAAFSSYIYKFTGQ